MKSCLTQTKISLAIAAVLLANGQIFAATEQDNKKTSAQKMVETISVFGTKRSAAENVQEVPAQGHCQLIEFG